MRTEAVLNFFIQLIFSHVICTLRERSIMISVLKRDDSFVGNSFRSFPIARSHQKTLISWCTWGLISSFLPSGWMSTRSLSLIETIFSLTASSYTFATITDIHEVFDTFWNEDILCVFFSPIRMDDHMSCVTRSSEYESKNSRLYQISFCVFREKVLYLLFCVASQWTVSLLSCDVMIWWTSLSLSLSLSWHSFRRPNLCRRSRSCRWIWARHLCCSGELKTTIHFWNDACLSWLLIREVVLPSMWWSWSKLSSPSFRSSPSSITYWSPL